MSLIRTRLFSSWQLDANYGAKDLKRPMRFTCIITIEKRSYILDSQRSDEKPDG